MWCLWWYSSCNQPLASSASVTVEEDSSVDFALTVSDPNGDVLTINIVYGPDQGSIEFLGGTNLRYSPNDNYFGSDEFGYTVTDGLWTSDVAAVYVDVIGVNDAPTATGFDIIVTDGGSVSLDSYVDDADEDDINIVSIPSFNPPHLRTAFGGSLTLGENGEYVYSSPATNPATDFLLFKADDGLTQSSMAFGTLNVDSDARDSWRNRMIPPTAFDDATQTQRN
jgi:hypothetical protein